MSKCLFCFNLSRIVHVMMVVRHGDGVIVGGGGIVVVVFLVYNTPDKTNLTDKILIYCI